MAGVPLHRNRDFVLFQFGQLLSSTGSQVTSIAYPLLVLSLTHSASKAGIVSFARIAPMALCALPAGLAADHWSRRMLMMAADGVRLVTVAGLGTALVVHRITFWAIPPVAFLEGAAATVFAAAQAGAVRAVVPAPQLPGAVGAQSGRDAVVRLVGPPAGGALFGLARALPFLVDAASYTCSLVSLLAMRTPFEQARRPDHAPLPVRVAEGIRFLWAHPFLRTCALLFGLANFLGPGLLLAVVVVGRRQGLSAGAVGGLVAAFGACLLVGSLLSPLVRRRLSVRATLLLELWSWTTCSSYLLWPNVYVLVAGMLPAAVSIPSTDSVVHGLRLALTPDRLLGRAESARSAISLAIAPLGPLVAGVLLTVSGRAAVALFAALALALALWGTLSPSIRAAPALERADTAS